MKSGKSLELIAQVAPYSHTEQEVLYVQPSANTRDSSNVSSRLGVSTAALTVESLGDITQPFDVIGIDEVHMYNENDAEVVDKWLREDKNIIASGLDIDYRAKMLPIIIRLLELKPDQLIMKNAVCDVCKKYDAKFTQIVDGGKPLLGGLPTVTIDDGRFDFQARCRDCFEKEK